MTFKELAREVCKREGKKQGVNIAQVSEVLRCLGEILAEERYGVINAVGEMIELIAELTPEPKKKRGKRK